MSLTNHLLLSLAIKCLVKSTNPLSSWQHFHQGVPSSPCSLLGIKHHLLLKQLSAVMSTWLHCEGAFAQHILASWYILEIASPSRTDERFPLIVCLAFMLSTSSEDADRWLKWWPPPSPLFIQRLWCHHGEACWTSQREDEHATLHRTAPSN